MNILEAVELMKIGKSVRRADWGREFSIHLRLGEANFNNVTGSKLHGIPVSFFKGAEFEKTTLPSIALYGKNVIEPYTQLRIVDIIATDWEIYEG